MRVLLWAFALLLATTPAADATLVFNEGSDTSRSTVWVANDDGTNPKRIAVAGLNPRISPDGVTVAYQDPAQPRLLSVPAVGGKPTVLLDPQWSPDTQAWSPDSRYLAAVTGHEIGTKRLVLIDLSTGKHRTVATGQFYGVSFSPSGGAIVYARATTDSYPPRSALWVAAVGGGRPMRITRSHPDIYPLWGPNAVVFTRQRKPPRKFDAWKQDLYLVAPDGSTPRRLTFQSPSFLLAGLTPVSWSSDGTRLLAQFGGQDTAFAQTVNVKTGRVRTVGHESDLIIPARLAADGETILAMQGGYEPGDETDVITVPYKGGNPRVLVRHAFSPDWNR
ncbi:MAG: hypothetical protein QOJ29_4876 [Thermoleophilaceae bacterium]|jgi:Tol biopolymer transport system component|nr:hypothetical protein [Thermoleophilaceae bacterium]